MLFSTFIIPDRYVKLEYCTMAKSAVSAEQLEVILSNVLSKTLPEIMIKTLEKFESQMDKLIEKLEARFEAKVDKLYGELFAANSRIDTLEAKLALQMATPRTAFGC